jgi:alpha-beta hydrolase superfamily lysophospholipase
MRQAQESEFTSFDGTPLFYRHWPAQGSGKRAIVIFHRGHEHSGRLQHVVDGLNLDDCAMFAWDARGHGRNPGERGYSPSIGTSIKDVDAFIRHICTNYAIDITDIVVVAQSVGAVLAAAWVHDYAPRIRGMVLASPAFKVKLYVPFARPGLKIMQALRGKFFVNSYVKAKFLTHDPERIASYNSDPLITRPIAANILLELYDTAERLVADAGAIQTPTQLLISGADWVVHHQPQHDFFDRLGSELKEKHVFKDFFHDTLGEKDRHLALDRARAFIKRLYAAPAAVPSLLDADKTGYTWNEYQALATPLPAWSPKGLVFAAARANMASFGRLSSGVSLGFATGFDSGSTLDYVYRNRAEGITPLGRLIDWFYLNAIGWRGIRVRKQHIERALHETVAKLAHSGTPIRILDIAAGHGRYVLEALDGIPEHVESVLLRDFSELNVAAGTRLIRQKDMTSLAQFERGDAFDEESLAGVTPHPTLAVVSGLYELFPDNAPVRASLSGLARAVEAGGYLVYTNQPWHPQVEFIARVLTSHRDGRPWIMRRRTQAEMDQLVDAAGFEKVDEYADDWGIFTVSVARRRV